MTALIHALLTLHLAAAPPAPAAGVVSARPAPADTFPRGQVIENVVSVSDTTQSYALYLPSDYDPARAWPVLFLMDPRGRALIPMRRLRAAAERHGYLAISSYNTLSDGPVEPNETAMQAMLADVQELFNVDARRFYLVGFSGTVRASWNLTLRLDGHVAGIIGAGAGLAIPLYRADLSPLAGTDLAFYGIVGTRDFNYEELRLARRRLDRFGIPNRLEVFDGPHAWAPTAALERAVEWMEARAMRAGWEPVDSARVAAWVADRLDRARRLEEDGRLVRALDLYVAITDDFGRWADVREARDAAVRLAGSRRVQRLRDRQEALSDEHWAYTESMRRLLADFRAADDPLPLEEARQRLEIRALKERENDEDDPLDAAAARRLLENVFVAAAFYEPRSYMRDGRPDKALRMLEIAAEIRPPRPRDCLFRARALTRLGRTQDALDAVACALEGGLPAGLIRDDPELAPLHGEPRFRELVRGS